jgi:TRAP-type mannitol/chloroaromatic compound transport system substrate-binding protein
MYHSAETYFQKKSPALTFFTAMPYGFTADEMLAWLQHGGGQQLWDALSGQFNIKPLVCTSSGCQMGGWFTREITSLDALKGLRYRMGSGAETLRRLGATVVTLPGGEIATALKSGAIDAAEWIGPWPDMAIGLHKACGYYYYPGFHEPGSLFSLGINKRVWESFDHGDQKLFEACATAEYELSLAEFNINNAKALSKLRADGCVKIVEFSDKLLKAFLNISEEVAADIGTGDELSKKIYASYQAFRDSIMDWSDISQRAYMNSRRLV